jgi:C4-dicarboxylate-specific signal transduction histidine kinase
MSIPESTRARQFENTSAWPGSLSIAIVDAAARFYANPPIGRGAQRQALRRVCDFSKMHLTKNLRLEMVAEARGLSTLQMELIHANRVAIVEQLSSSIVQELTHPIATARNNARVALLVSERDPLNAAWLGEALGCAVSDIDRAGKIIHSVRELLDPPAEIDCFDINEAICDVIILTRGEAVKHRVSIQTHFAERLTSVQADRVQVQQVMINLIINAIQAMSAVDATRDLHVSTSNIVSGNVQVTVRDSGPDLRADELEHIFEPFYRTNAGATRMGLAVCRWIIEAHGGQLWAAPHKSRGAVFQFILPREGRGSTYCLSDPLFTDADRP